MTDEPIQPAESANTPVTEPAAKTTASPGATASDVPPGRISVHPGSEFFDAAMLQRGVGIRFKGKVRRDIEEYSIPEGWVRVQAGKTMDRHGRPLTIKLNGPVEAWFEDLGDEPPVAKI